MTVPAMMMMMMIEMFMIVIATVQVASANSCLREAGVELHESFGLIMTLTNARLGTRCY